ncbi:hypothetical protein BKA70DRAFT_1238324 [Coprinopsis sp. MPI-PUGE-AT-0042]|nr:hypothetical protein BKA70DRAFT_1238324 [Coprinopsis sp. MPI-PUGE-AT-0042]
MPKEPVTFSTRVTRSRSSTPVPSMKIRQVNNPSNLRRSLGRHDPEGRAATSSEAVDISSSSDSESSGFRIISDAPLIERLSAESGEQEEGRITDRADAGLIQGPSDSASDLSAIIERQKRQLRLKTSALGRKNKEIKALKERIAELDEEAEEKQSRLDQSEKNEVQYRNWWLNEIQFTKLLLNKIPNPNRDIDLVRTSQAHYVGHY